VLQWHGAMSLLGLMCHHHFLTVVKMGWAPVDFFVPQCVLCDPAGLFFTLLIFLAIAALQHEKNKNNN